MVSPLRNIDCTLTISGCFSLVLFAEAHGRGGGWVGSTGVEKGASELIQGLHPSQFPLHHEHLCLLL